MSSTRIFRSTPSLASSLNTAVLLYCNYELYRVWKGTHPYFSPRLEASGLLQKPTDTAANTAGNKPAEKRIEALEKSEVGWTNLNGIPIPRFEMLIRPFRRD